MESNKERTMFIIRNSLLIDLFENANIRTVYHLFIATFIGFFVNTTVSDYLKHKRVVLGLEIIRQGFGQLHIALIAWTGYFVVTCAIYFFFKLWAKHRSFSSLRVTKIWDYFWTLLLSFYYVASFQTANFIVTNYNLKVASAAIVVIEQTRFLMKIHSFVRNAAPKFLKLHNEETFPSFSSYLYFLFVPTLIYQDTYPRRKSIDWNFAFFRLLECVSVIFYMSFVTDRFLYPSVENFGLQKFTVNEIIVCIFENTITGIFFLLPMFFLVLHSWQNLFGELTKFGDRLFYDDWWTCTSFSCYFRKWNIIVQKWLFFYIYRDFKNHLRIGKTLSKMSVFLISAIIHEWILTYMFGFFFPLLFIEFVVFGSILSFVGLPKSPPFNVLFWYMLALGMGSLVTMYGIEFYARLNKPIANPTFKDNIVPRFLTCDCIEF